VNAVGDAVFHVPSLCALALNSCLLCSSEGVGSSDGENIREGDRVKLHGLSKAAHLNGLHGRVAMVSGAGSGGRIEVALDNGTHVKVLGKNLALLPR
jgi:hypothetical protein